MLCHVCPSYVLLPRVGKNVLTLCNIDTATFCTNNCREGRAVWYVVTGTVRARVIRIPGITFSSHSLYLYVRTLLRL